jgi:hypothetical protein
MSKGYFSLVQYCPDVARQEAVNVGVVLLCPERHFIGAKMARKNNRVRRLFKHDADGTEHLDAMKNALASRIRVEASDLLTLDSFGTFVQSRGNKVLLTNPKPVRVDNPAADLAALYDELVREPQQSVSEQAEIPLPERLDEAFEDVRLRPFLKHCVSVNVPAFKKQIEVPYGYKNERFNLIQPAHFTPRTFKRAACELAVEGHSLFNHPDPNLGELRLVIVAEFPNEEAIPVVRDMFAENQVKLVISDKLADFVDEIAAHGKPLTAE